VLTTKRLRRSQEGSVVVTAVMLISIMLMIGLAALSRVDTQSEETRRERVRESAFNYSEAALSAQIFLLGRKGTGTADAPMPEVCPAGGGVFCADPEQIARNYDQATNKDFDPDEIQWRTWVRDNAPGTVGGQPDTFWEDSLLTTRPRYDANGDDLMWVRAEATVRDRTRAMVGLIRIEYRPANFPQYAILAGRFRTTNNGKHSDVIVNANGSLGVQVRCDTSLPPEDKDNTCLSYKPSQGQISPPNAAQDNYQGDVSAIGTDELDALMDVARANGTYYTSCPNDLSGKVVVIDTTSSCAWQGNDTFNSATYPPGPGLLIVTRGKIEFRGGATFNGLIYHANLGGSSASDLVKVHGNSQVYGGVLVDGDGGLESGSSGKQNIRFNTNAFTGIVTFGTAGVVQNTWREIRPLES
jgi:hypothetical protein